MKSWRIWLFLISTLFGLYFINSSLEIYTIPEIVLEMNNWITLVGGILIILGGIGLLRSSRRKQMFEFSR